MEIFRKIGEVRNFIRIAKSQGKRISLIPTMGALHDGHMSLLEKAHTNADVSICSIFVNPAQFGPNEDFEKYPRTESKDISLLQNEDCKAVFIPDKDEIYSEKPSFDIMVKKNADVLCGYFRPGHFNGVALIVLKLFNIINPDVAIFGEKDFQQLWIIKNMVEELNLQTEIISSATLREKDGLAMSSRNRYLNQDERKIAPALYEALISAAKKLRGGDSVIDTVNEAKKFIVSSGFTKLDYLEIRQEDDLSLTKKPDVKSRIFAATWLNKTRLIDSLKIF